MCRTPAAVCASPWTYVISDVDVGVFLQQQRNQTLTLPLADVVQSRVPLLQRQALVTRWQRERHPQAPPTSDSMGQRTNATEKLQK